MGFYPFAPLPVSGALVTPPINFQAASQATELFGTGVTGDTFNRIELRAGSAAGGSGGIALGSGAIAPDSFITRPGVNTLRSSGTFQLAAGSLDVQAAGSGLAVAEGANAKQGTATLAAGTVVVANTSVTANSRIVCGLVTLGTVTVPSALGVSARTAGTSFTILASQATDTSVVWYEIFEPG